jgi:hypothetical protein
MKPKTFYTLVLAISASAPLLAHSAVLNVPLSYPTIQAAIDVAISGDVVRVAAGTYYENPVIQNKAISLIGEGAASTILDGSANGRVLTVTDVTTGQVTIAGFTIQNGVANPPDQYKGGGINGYNANLVVRDNVITANAACVGMALAQEFGSITLRRNRIHANFEPLGSGCGSVAVDIFVGGLNYIDHNVIADHQVSGMEAYSDGGTMYFRHNVFRNNVWVPGNGRNWGGLGATGDLVVENNLFANNSSFQHGGAFLHQYEQGHGYIRNNSFVGNQGGSSSGMTIEATLGTNLTVTNNLMNDDQEFIAEIYCGRTPITIAANNVFASATNATIGGTCVQP